jgi:prolyl 4-hydroxylase
MDAAVLSAACSRTDGVQVSKQRCSSVGTCNGANSTASHSFTGVAAATSALLVNEAGTAADSTADKDKQQRLMCDWLKGQCEQRHTSMDGAHLQLSSSEDSDDSSDYTSDDDDSSEPEDAPDTDLHEPDLPRSLNLLQRLTLKPSPVLIPPNCISLHYLHAFLSEEECTHLIELSHGQFSRSTTYSGISASRTSHSASLSRYNPVVAAVRQRVMELTGTKSSRCIQGPSVVRYEPGQQFKPHYDSRLEDDEDGHPPREFTVFVYLNTMPPDAGGETEFTQIGVKFTPKAGDALFWRNHKDRFTESFKESMHAGRPPLSGVKYGQSACSATQLIACPDAAWTSRSLRLSSRCCALIKV